MPQIFVHIVFLKISILAVAVAFQFLADVFCVSSFTRTNVACR